MKEQQDLASLTQKLSAEYKRSDSPQESLPQGTPESLFSYQRVLEAERRILDICAKYGIEMETRGYGQPLSFFQQFPATSTAVTVGGVVFAASSAQWASLGYELVQGFHHLNVSDYAVVATLSGICALLESLPVFLTVETAFLFDMVRNGRNGRLVLKQ